MQLNNTLDAYSLKEIEEFGIKIGSLVETLRETVIVLERELKSPTPKPEGENVVHIDLRPLVEFQRLERTPMPFHEILNTYDRWNDILWELVHANIGQYNNKKMVVVLVQLQQAVSTFQNFFAAGSVN